MIKKLLLIILIIPALKLSLFGQACTPSPTYTNTTTQNGVYPDSVKNFDTAYVNVPYSQLVTIVVPPDTTPSFPPIPIPWDSTVITSVSGLPSSLTYACWNHNGSGNPNRCSWKGNSIGCAIITGTPTLSDVGTHSLQFVTNSYLGGSTTPNTYTIKYYRIVVKPATNGVDENPKLQFLMQNNPNPFDEQSEIQFTADENGIAQLKIYNLIGTVIKQYEINVKRGVNKLELNGKDFDSGVYFYSISHGNTAFTRKMVVNR
ncbi:MAG TPA: T9SS type A sorting domain-containing protein [Bacteroidia bacterium]